MSRETIQGLWVGKLGPMGRLSIRSFLANGHPYRLWTYQDRSELDGLPSNTEVRDADEIMPYAEYNYLATFADVFRYRLLHLRGGWWADMDVVCAKPFDFGDRHVLCSEGINDDKAEIPSNAVIRAPKDSPLLAWLDGYIKTLPPPEKWGTLMGLLSNGVEALDLWDYVEPASSFCPIPWWKASEYLEGTMGSFLNSYAFHLWHNRWLEEGFSENASSGIYGELKVKYGCSV